jgi:hypothetical protein
MRGLLCCTGQVKTGYREPKKDEEADGPFGPYHEPKGNDIEKSLLQFLLDVGVDVNDRLITRNRTEDVVCFVPFSNKDKIKITARAIPNEEDWKNENVPEVYIVV